MLTIDKGIMDFEIARKRIVKNFSEVLPKFWKVFSEGGG